MMAAWATPPTSPPASAAAVGGAPMRRSCALVATLPSIKTAPIRPPSIVRDGEPRQSAPMPSLDTMPRAASMGFCFVRVTGNDEDEEDESSRGEGGQHEQW